MGLRGFVLGVLGLSALYTLVGTRQGPDRAAGLVGVGVALTQAVLDPNRPAVPDFRKPRTPLVVDNPAAAGGSHTAGSATVRQALYAAYRQPPAATVNYAL